MPLFAAAPLVTLTCDRSLANSPLPFASSRTWSTAAFVVPDEGCTRIPVPLPHYGIDYPCLCPGGHEAETRARAAGTAANHTALNVELQARVEDNAAASA